MTFAILAFQNVVQNFLKNEPHLFSLLSAFIYDITLMIVVGNTHRYGSLGGNGKFNFNLL